MTTGTHSRRLRRGFPVAKKLSSAQLLSKYRARLVELRSEGMGRCRCSATLTAETGFDISPGVVAVAFEKLDGKRTVHRAEAVPIEEDESPDDLETEIPIDELIDERVRKSQLYISRAAKHRRVLKIPCAPTGLFVMGDPHVDNEGCDWGTLFDHVKMVQQSEGVLCANVGDVNDNWIGRLQRLYSKSSVSAKDGWRLSEWLLDALHWLAVVGGNHDAWANGPGIDVLESLCRKHGVRAYAPDELRVILAWKDAPDLEPVDWIIRHNFKGHSWFHPTHGPHKEAMLDGRAHLLTAGHTHEWGVLTTEQRHARVTTSMRVRGYKKNDDYARQLQFYEQTTGESALVTIDPFAKHADRIKAFFNVEAGLEYLAFLRGRTREI